MIKYIMLHALLQLVVKSKWSVPLGLTKKEQWEVDLICSNHTEVDSELQEVFRSRNV